MSESIVTIKIDVQTKNTELAKSNTIKIINPQPADEPNTVIEDSGMKLFVWFGKYDDWVCEYHKSICDD